GRNREQRALASPGHPSIDRAELHRHHMHSAGGEPPAQALRKDGERAFGRAVHIIACATALAGDRSDHDDETGELLFEMAGGESNQGHGAGEVLMNRGKRGAGVGLSGVFVAERAEACDDSVESAELARGAADELVVRGKIRRVEGPGKSGHSRANADIFRNAPSLIGVAGGEVQARSIGCEAKRECTRDRAGGAKNKNFCHRAIKLAPSFRRDTSQACATGSTRSGCQDRRRPLPPATWRDSDTSRERSPEKGARPWPGTRGHRA